MNCTAICIPYRRFAFLISERLWQPLPTGHSVSVPRISSNGQDFTQRGLSQKDCRKHLGNVMCTLHLPFVASCACCACCSPEAHMQHFTGSVQLHRMSMEISCPVPAFCSNSAATKWTSGELRFFLQHIKATTGISVTYTLHLPLPPSTVVENVSISISNKRMGSRPSLSN